MKLISQLVALLLLLPAQVAFASEVVGEGRGETEAVARREALSDLSSRISVTVRSNFKSIQTVNAQTGQNKKAEVVLQAAQNMLETNSELPILGAKFTSSNEGNQILVKAVLETSKSLPLYQARLEELHTRMAALNDRASKDKSLTTQSVTIMDILALLEEFKKFNTVNTYLSGKPQTSGVDEDVLRSQLRAARQQVVGEGWGDTEAAARREALSDLSSRISVTVRSSFKSTQTVNSLTVEKTKTEVVLQSANNTMETNSELPILGADFVTNNEGSQISVKAVLETSKSLPLYEARLNELHSRMAALNSRVSKEKAGATQYAAIMDIFTMLDEFKKLNTVNTYLGGKPQSSGVDEDALQSQLRATRKAVDSLDLAAQFMAEGIDESAVYIFPARASNSNEVTQFSAIMRDKLSKYIKTALTPREATYMLLGQYEETGEGIDITYRLLDSSALAQKTNSVHLAKAAYAGIVTTPKTTDFDQLLKAGVAVSGNLRAEVSTNQGSHDLLFEEGDEIELMVKLSEQGYFYVVGHTVKDSEKNSYLVELRDVEAPQKFVYFVNAVDANKWINIGKFQVAPPYGVEGLQVFASNKNLADSLPSVKFDSASGLYLVAAANHTEGIVKTRAIIKKFSKTAETSEASLMFTTKAK
ncbi:MAG: hypothetical protein PHQ60_15585 [Sideroxydans sp.]|nr:hypothetical protein [Sideroxydans sp.]